MPVAPARVLATTKESVLAIHYASTFPLSFEELHDQTRRALSSAEVNGTISAEKPIVLVVFGPTNVHAEASYGRIQYPSCLHLLNQAVQDILHRVEAMGTDILQAIFVSRQPTLSF